MSQPLDSTGAPRCPNCGCHYIGMHTCGPWPPSAQLVTLNLTALSERNQKRIEALEFALRRILAVWARNDPVLERICREALEAEP